LTKGNVVTNGVRLAYEVVGTGDPILLIAGTGMPKEAWGLLGVSALRDAGHQVITFDNRGVGESDGPPAPYTVEDMARDAIGLVEALELVGVAVVGLSLGGSIGQEMARLRPDLVRALVLWAGVGRPPVFFRRLMAVQRQMRATMALPESWYRWQTLLISLPFEVLQNDDTTVEQVAELLEGGIVWSGDGAAGQFSAGVEWDTTEHADLYRHMMCPCLVVAHEHDLIFPPASARAAAAAMPDASVIEIPGLAHGQAPDAAPIVMREILAFLPRATRELGISDG
jgi:pimeloyl-ACP methyl ester carboxylesterase